MDSLLHKVEELLRHVAEQEILSRFQNLKETDIFLKDNYGDVVTSADLEAENRIREGLLKLLPGSLVIGEEAAHKTPSLMDKLNGRAPVWVVDPVDGTRNFSKGKACFAVICALVIDGQTEMGWILDPIAGACVVARKDCGAYINGQKLTQSFIPPNLTAMTGSFDGSLKKRLLAESDLNRPERFVRYHCVGREYMDLALGKLHFAQYGGKMMPWDHAAGVLIMNETGRYVRTIKGKRPYSPRFRGASESLLISSNEDSFDALVTLINRGTAL